MPQVAVRVPSKFLVTGENTGADPGGESGAEGQRGTGAQSLPLCPRAPVPPSPFRQ